MINEDLKKLLACPRCKGSLEEVKNSLICNSCKAKYSVKNNIPVFI